MMSNTLFYGNASDGIDIDFGTGEVKDCKFMDNAGDGLDLSGSEIRITGSLFVNTGDKGISVGENSHPIIINNLFKNNTIAISTKDLSSAKVANCTFYHNKLAIEAKRKKPMFGPGSGEFINCVFSGNQTLFKEDFFSRGLVTFGQSITDNSFVQQDHNLVFVPIRFVAPEDQNYVLAFDFIERRSIEPVFPRWYQKEIPYRQIQHPGIYTAINQSTGKSNESAKLN